MKQTKDKRLNLIDEPTLKKQKHESSQTTFVPVGRPFAYSKKVVGINKPAEWTDFIIHCSDGDLHISYVFAGTFSSYFTKTLWGLNDNTTVIDSVETMYTMIVGSMFRKGYIRKRLAKCPYEKLLVFLTAADYYGFKMVKSELCLNLYSTNEYKTDTLRLYLDFPFLRRNLKIVMREKMARFRNDPRWEQLKEHFDDIFRDGDDFNSDDDSNCEISSDDDGDADADSE